MAMEAPAKFTVSEGKDTAFQRFLARVILPVIRLLMRVFFRRITLVGADRVPADRPLIFTPNHGNSLIDGFLALGFLPRKPRALAKASLWQNPLSRALVVAANCIPVHRRQDSRTGDVGGRNVEMFKDCGEVLARNNCLVLFPEGTSHDEPSLKPLKTGAARIVLGAEQQHGPLQTSIVPVGFNFDAKERFRSRVLITIGEPIQPLEDGDRADPEDREAVAELTARIDRGLRQVTINFPSWEEAELILRAADIYHSSQPQHADGEDCVAGQFPTRKQLSDSYPLMKERYPRKVVRVSRAVQSYDRMLNVLSLRHEHVVGNSESLLSRLTSVRRASLFLVRLPLALIGLFLNAVPYYVTKLINRFRFPKDRASTAKLFVGIVVFNICWVVQAWLGEELVPPFLGWLLAPVSGIATLLFRERYAQIMDELRTYLFLNTNEDLREEVEQRRVLVVEEVADFINTAARLPSPSPPTSTGEVD
jgi:glycerol-3-phosphate O-acyltransferase/dihydroxyacetone phosphate acyltransferase